jgi:hypothetical protein
MVKNRPWGGPSIDDETAPPRKRNPVNKPTAKQLAARKEFARIMKSGGFKANPEARKPAAKKAAPVRKPAAKRPAVKRNPARGMPTPTVSHTAKVYLLEMSRDGRVWNVEHAFASFHFAISKAHAMAADEPRYHFRVRDIRVAQ